MISYKTLIILFSFVCILNLNAKETRTITGRIFNKSTGAVIAGATIRIPKTNIGTYSSASGFFRLKIPANSAKLKISSLGYKSQMKDIKNNIDTIFIYLNETIVKNKGVTVTGNIEPNEIIRRAIERKKDNLRKLKTFKGRLYSKLLIELDGSLFATGQGGNSIILGTQTSEDSLTKEKYKLFLLESFSDMYIDYDKNIHHSEILQRRQTSNLSPNDNLLAIGNFINFYDDEITIINTSIVTPLSENAFSYYNFEILDRQFYDNKYVYVISVTPSTTLYPAFTGTIKLLEGSYNLIGANLQPSGSTAITFIEDLIIEQRFTESVEKIWYPSYLEIKGKSNVDVVKGILDLKADLTATSIYSDVIINQPLPDSIYKQKAKRTLSVTAEADSAKSEFWENNALREISEKEKQIYSKIDSIIVKDSINQEEQYSAFDWTWMPYLDFNRVSSISPGLSLEFNLYDFELSGTASYSFGLRNVLWNAIFSHLFSFGENNRIILGIEGFSKAGRISLDRSYSRLVNTAVAGLFHFDYYDYQRTEGVSFAVEFENSLFELSASLELSNQESLNKTTNRSIFSNRQWRDNPQITNGKYTTGFLQGKIGEVNYIIPTRHFENELEFSSVLGLESNSQKSFFSIVGKYKSSIPLFKTGYGPIKLFIALEGGLSSDYIPMQYLNKMQSAMLFINKYGNFLSAPPAEYGGREYYSANAALNLTDLWWRFLRLPLFDGRGLNLILAGSYSRFFSKGETIYKDTEGRHYSEIGFGVTRIPTFVSNVIYLSFDARWGIGPIASGRFGWALSVSFPF